MSKVVRPYAAPIAMLGAQGGVTNREFYRQLSIRPVSGFFASSQRAKKTKKKPPAMAAGGVSTDSADGWAGLKRPSP
jgi:hypothetical protein